MRIKWWNLKKNLYCSQTLNHWTLCLNSVQIFPILTETVMVISKNFSLWYLKNNPQTLSRFCSVKICWHTGTDTFDVTNTGRNVCSKSLLRTAVYKKHSKGYLAPKFHRFDTLNKKKQQTSPFKMLPAQTWSEVKGLEMQPHLWLVAKLLVDGTKVFQLLSELH